MKRYRTTGISQYIIIAIALVIVIGIGFLSTFLMKNIQYTDQFVIPWAAGRMWLLEGSNPYDYEVLNFARETLSLSNYLGELPKTTSLNIPVIQLIFYLPFSLVPYQISRALWITILTICTISIGYLSLNLSGWRLSRNGILLVILLVTLWFPSVMTILQGHISPVILLLIFYSTFLILKRQDTAAGLILALTFGDFITAVLIIIFIVVWSISRRRWSVTGSFFSGLSFLILISVLMLPSWPLDWLRIFVQNFDRIDVLQTPLVLLANRLPGIAQYLSIALHIIVFLYLLVHWITLWGKIGRVFVWKTLMTFVAVYLLNIQASNYQLFLIIPAMFMIFRFWSDRWRLMGTLLSWAFLILVTGGSWLLVYPNIDFILTEPFFALNVVLPILILIGMIWNRWWAIKIPKFIFENHESL
jgi:hypothetical protein